MNHLYAPWRNNYINKKNSDGSCIFCTCIAEQNDAQHFIIKRFEHCYAMLNLFPYNAGHLLIIPYEHQDSLEKLPQATRHEIIDVTSTSTTLLKDLFAADGINVGLNIGGPAAGGSIPEHLHMHVLPRWLGDTNFLVTLADTKQISADLHEVYKKLVTSKLW